MGRHYGVDDPCAGPCFRCGCRRLLLRRYESDWHFTLMNVELFILSAALCSAVGIRGPQDTDVLGRSRGASKTEFISLAFRVPRVTIR